MCVCVHNVCVCIREKDDFIVSLGRLSISVLFVLPRWSVERWLSQTGSKTSPLSQSDTSIEELPGTLGLILYLIPFLQCQPAPIATSEITQHTLDLHRVFPTPNGLPLNLQPMSAPIMKPKCLIYQQMMLRCECVPTVLHLWSSVRVRERACWWMCVCAGFLLLSESQI